MSNRSRSAAPSPVDLARHAKSQILTPAWEEVVRDFYATTYRMLIACVGRGGRKTTTLAMIAVFEAVARHKEHERHALPGTRVLYVIVAPAIRQAREAVRAVRAVLDELHIRYELRGESDVPEIDLAVPGAACQSTITVLVADAATSRGFPVAFLGVTEASYFPSEGAGTLAEIMRAIRPRMAAQFPAHRIVVESTPGAPAGWFYQAVEKHPPDALVIRRASYAMNPAIDPEAARAGCASEHEFRQEVLASAWGFAGTSIFSTEQILKCVSPKAGCGPRAGVEFVIGGDLGQLHDGAAEIVVSCELVDVGSVSPVRVFTVDHCDVVTGSKERPVLVRDWCARLAALARSYGGARVRVDSRAQPEVEVEFRTRGVRHEFCPMHAAAQDARWRLLIDAINGRRLKIPNDERLIKQLAGIEGTQHSNGLLKIEGRRVADDLVDALALAMEGALRVQPGGDIERVYEPVRWDPSSRTLSGGDAGYYRVLPSGRRVPVEPPTDDPAFEQYASRLLRQGISTPAIERWMSERPGWRAED